MVLDTGQKQEVPVSHYLQLCPLRFGDPSGSSSIFNKLFSKKQTLWNMLLAGLFYSPFFFGTRPGGGGGVLAFLQCVLCAWPGLGWDPYPLFTLSHFSDPPPQFPSSPLNTPTLPSQPIGCSTAIARNNPVLHKTPLTLSSLYHLPQQFLMFSLYFCAVWAPWQQVPVLVTQIRWVV